MPPPTCLLRADRTGGSQEALDTELGKWLAVTWRSFTAPDSMDRYESLTVIDTEASKSLVVILFDWLHTFLSQL